MKIFVDADACPVVRIVEEVAEKYRIDVTLLCDTNHILNSDYSEVIVVGAGVETLRKGRRKTIRDLHSRLRSWC